MKGLEFFEKEIYKENTKSRLNKIHEEIASINKIGNIPYSSEFSYTQFEVQADGNSYKCLMHTKGNWTTHLNNVPIEVSLPISLKREYSKWVEKSVDQVIPELIEKDVCYIDIIIKYLTEYRLKVKSFPKSCTYISILLEEFIETLIRTHPLYFKKSSFGNPKIDDMLLLPISAISDLEAIFFLEGQKKPLSLEITNSDWCNLMTNGDESIRNVRLEYDTMIVGALIVKLARKYLERGSYVKFYRTIEQSKFFLTKKSNKGSDNILTESLIKKGASNIKNDYKLNGIISSFILGVD